MRFVERACFKNEATEVQKWLARIPGEKPLAVILGAGTHGLSFSRSLGRRHVPTMLLDSHKDESLYGRYGRSCLLPPIKEFTSDWLSFLELVGSRLEKPGVIFVTSDAFLLFLSRNRENLGKYFRFIIPGSQTVEQLVNKRAQYTIAERAGIGIPKTLYPESIADARSWAADIPYPCVLKPYTYEGRELIGKHVILVHSPAELIEGFERVSNSGQGFMIQELIPDSPTDRFAYNGFWDAERKEKAWWTRQAMRGLPFGTCSIQLTVDVPELAALSRRLLAAFDYCGFANIQFNLDVRDRKYRLMEINARTGQMNQLGVSAGVDFPWIGYCYLCGASTRAEISFPFEQGVTFMDESADLELWRSGSIGFGSWLGSFLRSQAKAYWSWNDPGPFLALAWKFGAPRLGRKLARFLSLRVT